MKQILRAALLLAGLVPALQSNAERAMFNLSFDGLFDNREYKNGMLPQTIYGMRLMPEAGIGNGRHSLYGGVSQIWEFGAADQPDAGAVLYYRYNGADWRACFGSFPRTRLQRQLPDCMLYDSLAFFNPCIQGTAVQYYGNLVQAEAYCNWFSRQTQTQREAFRIVSDGFIGKSGTILGGGWFLTLTHFAKPKENGHFIYEQFQAYPYMQLDFDRMLPEQTSLQAHIGILGSFQRLRAEDRWHTPTGLLAGLDGSWKGFQIHSTIYSGKAMMPFLNDGEAGIRFYRSDPFYNHSFYCKAGLEYVFIKDNAISFSFCWDLNFTPDTPVHNRQLVKLSYSFSGEKAFQTVRP